MEGRQEGQETLLKDPFGRSFPYVRLSLTELCNYDCTYCLPKKKKLPLEDELSPTEIGRLTRALVELNVKKIRLTGGEPTLRPDFLDIVEEISKESQVEELALTTNGYKLKEQAYDFYRSGITSLNISLDSLNPSTFLSITKRDHLKKLLEGIEKSLKLGFRKVKLNVVLLKDINDKEFPFFLDFVKDKPLDIRFIELMQTLKNRDFFLKHHLLVDDFKEKLLREGWSKVPEKKLLEGPSENYVHSESLGRVGFIAPYSKDFCKGCSRLRILSKGELYLCLFGDRRYPLRSFLQSDLQKKGLQEYLRDILGNKKKSHFLHENYSGMNKSFSEIGG